MNIKVSIIIPSLNVVEYISQCLSSVCEQTLCEIEIICVDADSTDGTREIIQEFASRDKRIRVICSNIRSYGYQVNKGISCSTGEYIAIVESDDYIAENMMEHLYYQAKKYNVDISKADRMSVYSDGRSIEKHIFLGQDEKNYNRVINIRDVPMIFIDDYNLWNGIYRRKYIIDNKIKLNESSGAAFQDVGFQQQVHLLAENMVFSNKIMYFYRVAREGSSTNSSRRLKFLRQELEFVEDYVAKINPKKWDLRKNYIHARLCKYFIEELKFAVVDCKRTITSIEAENEYRKIQSCIYRWDRCNNEYKEVLNEKEINEIEKAVIGLNEYVNLFDEYEKENRKIEKYILNSIGDKKCIIYGCGSWGMKLGELLLEWGKDFVAYSDGDKNKWYKDILGIKVLPIEEIIKKWPNIIVLVTSKNHGNEIKEKILDLGIKDKEIIVYNRV